MSGLGFVANNVRNVNESSSNHDNNNTSSSNVYKPNTPSPSSNSVREEITPERKKEIAIEDEKRRIGRELEDKKKQEQDQIILQYKQKLNEWTKNYYTRVSDYRLYYYDTIPILSSYSTMLDKTKNAILGFRIIDTYPLTIFNVSDKEFSDQEIQIYISTLSFDKPQLISKDIILKDKQTFLKTIEEYIKSYDILLLELSETKEVVLNKLNQIKENQKIVKNNSNEQNLIQIFKKWKKYNYDMFFYNVELIINNYFLVKDETQYKAFLKDKDQQEKIKYILSKKKGGKRRSRKSKKSKKISHRRRTARKIHRRK